MIRPALADGDSRFLAYLRGIAILVIVFGHVGGFWFFRPYSEFLDAFVPVLFFLSGAVSYYSYRRAKTVGEYLKKRVVGLLVPYYLACLLSLSVYTVANGIFPPFSMRDVLMQLTIRPAGALQGFEMGPVWFLHTLMVITIASPVYFWLYERKPWLLVCLLSIPLGLSGVQLLHSIRGLFNLAGNNLYRPIVHTVFYLFGSVYFSSDVLRKGSVLIGLMAAGLLLSVGLVAALDLNPDYEYHTSPDLYYVAGSLAAIAGLLLLQQSLLHACTRMPRAARILGFMHRYTFSIYLLHSFAIYVAEEWLGLLHPTSGYVRYGLIKFAFVLASTCVMSIPFGYLAERLTKLATGRLTRPRRTTKAEPPNAR